MSNNIVPARQEQSAQEIRADIQYEIADNAEDPARRFSREVIEVTKEKIVQSLKGTLTQEEADKNVIGALPHGRKYQNCFVHFSPPGVDEDGDGVAAEAQVSVEIENDEGEYIELTTEKIIL